MAQMDCKECPILARQTCQDCPALKASMQALQESARPLTLAADKVGTLETRLSEVKTEVTNLRSDGATYRAEMTALKEALSTQTSVIRYVAIAAYVLLVGILLSIGLWKNPGTLPGIDSTGVSAVAIPPR